MNRAALDRIASAVLYEGYLLYPYRASAVKNQQRFNFGALHPASWAERWNERSSLITEVLVRGRHARVEGAVRCLHLVEVPGPAGPWHQAREREVPLPRAGSEAFRLESLEEGQLPVQGRIEVSETEAGDDLRRVRIRVSNEGSLDPGASRETALRSALVAAHVLLGVEGGEFVSLLEPPEDARQAAESCRNVGCWPVLVGDPGGARDTMLASPIILYDHPAVAPESPGDLFDLAEIDEILSLRILTLTDEEKREARATDPRARALLDRTEALSQADLMRLHGRLREPRSGNGFQPGAHVRIRPRERSDVFDLALAGKAATVAAVERDLEGHLMLAVTVDDDPGRDLGVFGHRFFFRPDEVELLP